MKKLIGILNNQLDFKYIEVVNILRNKGNKFYKNTNGNIFRMKSNSKKKKKNALMKKMRNKIAPAAP